MFLSLASAGINFINRGGSGQSARLWSVGYCIGYCDRQSSRCTRAGRRNGRKSGLSTKETRHNRFEIIRATALSVDVQVEDVDVWHRFAIWTLRNDDTFHRAAPINETNSAAAVINRSSSDTAPPRASQRETGNNYPFFFPFSMPLHFLVLPACSGPRKLLPRGNSILFPLLIFLRVLFLAFPPPSNAL